MIKTILVRAPAEASNAAYATARCVAQRFDAHIDALHVRLDPIETAVGLSIEGAGGLLLRGIAEQFEQDASAVEAQARARFSSFCSEAGLALISDLAMRADRPSAMFHVETGQDARWMCAYGRTADLVIAARGVPGDDAVARSTLEALLLETGRPLLIPASVAPSPDVSHHVAIAWKPTPEAARAVAGAMPFLEQARHVVVLSVAEEDGRRDEADRLVRYLGWHGIAAHVERLAIRPDGAAATLLAAANATSGLLVMGGYGHTRLREWVFGGFTQHALDHADIPVLMAH